MSKVPVESSSTEVLEANYKDCLPSCVVTRAMQNKEELRDPSSTKQPAVYKFDLSKTFLHDLLGPTGTPSSETTRASMIQAQHQDPDIQPLFQKALNVEEADKVASCYMKRDGVLIRKWRSPLCQSNDQEAIVHQILVPRELRPHVLELAHDNPMAGHLGVRKTKARIFEHFWWPSAAKDIADYVRTCRTCQVVGKPNQKPPRAPLRPIPVMTEPFSEVLVDVVGPLCKTSKGHEYCLTIMDTSTRFVEAVPLQRATSQAITEALLKFFTLFGLPLVRRMDQGSNLTAQVLRQTLEQLGVQQIFGCAYRPQSQGAIKRFHQTLKSMIKTYVFEHKKDWDTGLQFLMYAARSSVQESLGFSPNELVFAHPIRGPLRLLKDLCMKRDKFENVLSYVSKMRTRLREAVSIAHETLRETQRKMKDRYDVDTVQRDFSPGDQVMVLLPTQTDPLHVTLAGPYVIVKKVDDLNYVVSTPDRRKRTQYCHVNMIKRYYPRSQLGTVSDKSTRNGLATLLFLPNSLQPQTQTANCSDTDGAKHDVTTVVNAELQRM